MSAKEQYEFIRNMQNPHRDSRPPYQNEMVQWNDGYDKGYAQAKKETEKIREADYNDLMNLRRRNEDLKSTLKALQAAIPGIDPKIGD